MEETIQKALHELFILSNTDNIKDYFAEDYIAVRGGKRYHGHRFIQIWAKQLSNCLDQRKIRSVEILVKTDDIIVWERRLQGVFAHNQWGIEATGKVIKWSEMIVSHFENGKIHKEKVVSDFIGQLLSSK